MFFHSAVFNWNSLDHKTRNAGSFIVFKNNILKFIRPAPNSVFDCKNHRGFKFITKPRVDLPDLRGRKFKHSFQDTLNPICSCGFDNESTSHYILRSPMYNNERVCLLSTVKNTDHRLLDLMETILIKTFLLGNCSLDAHANTKIFNATTEYILTTMRFGEPMFHS